MMDLILQSVKAKNIVNVLTIGIGGHPISDVTDSFLKGRAKKVRIVYADDRQFHNNIRK